MNTRSSHTIAEPEVLPPPTSTPAIDPGIREELLAQADERGQVTVHCRFSTPWGTRLRVWPGTYLICRTTGHRSALLHAEGISWYPAWMPVPAGTISFTLVFAPLPDGCTVFDLIEEIPEPGGFMVSGMVRNGSDLYDVEV
ncbi:MAG: hypothetical protein IT227_15525 [Flavobacteriales bacterium]|nr:hypothetical protein [Flavobacteriales bacterium]